MFKNLASAIQTFLLWKENLSHILLAFRRDPFTGAMFHLHCKSVKCELDVELFPFDERYPEGQKYLVMIYVVRIFFFLTSIGLLVQFGTSNP